MLWIVGFFVDLCHLCDFRGFCILVLDLCFKSLVFCSKIMVNSSIMHGLLELIWHVFHVIL